MTLKAPARWRPALTDTSPPLPLAAAGDACQEPSAGLDHVAGIQAFMVRCR
jgi:hypothetical protein